MSTDLQVPRKLAWVYAIALILVTLIGAGVIVGVLIARAQPAADITYESCSQIADKGFLPFVHHDLCLDSNFKLIPIP